LAVLLSVASSPQALQVIAQCFLFDEPQLHCQQKQGKHEADGTPENRFDFASHNATFFDNCDAAKGNSNTYPAPDSAWYAPHEAHVRDAMRYRPTRHEAN